MKWGGFMDSEREGWGPTLCKIGQLTFSMGQKWRNIHICASKSTTPSKVFLFGNPHAEVIEYYTTLY
jgi:hypothetical protein